MWKRMVVQWVLLLCMAIGCYKALSSKIELELQRYVQNYGFDVGNATGLRVTKFNRTTPVLNGTMRIFKNLDNNYKCSIRIASSRLGNNQFNDYPISWTEQPFCDMMKRAYRDYQFVFLNHSNLPQVTEDGLCPFPAGDYWFKNAVFPSSTVPNFLPDGYWRMTILITGAGNASVNIYARVRHTPV